jgi:ribosome biogenesis GTPase / thiamine phosphate phosphatase
VPPGRPTMKMPFEAQVIAAYGRHVLVRDAGGAVHEARPFGRRLELACGDRVRCEPDAAHGEVHVVATLPRSSALYRASARGLPEIVVANVTLVAIVLAPLPVPDLFVIDRYLAAAASGAVAACLVLNKTDLPGAADVHAGLTAFLAAGYGIVECSTAGEGRIEALRELLSRHTSVLVGQSGVGKSSLVARLVPDAQVLTGALARDDEGRHTTTSSRLYDLPAGGALIDSPGVRDFAPAIDTLEPRCLGYVEIDRLSTACRFQDCRHLREPGCAVQQAVQDGRLDARRYESYRRLRRVHDDLSAAHGRQRR